MPKLCLWLVQVPVQVWQYWSSVQGHAKHPFISVSPSAIPVEPLEILYTVLSFQDGVTWLMLSPKSPSLLSLHIEFLLIFWASVQIPLLLGSLPRMSCSLFCALKAFVCILLADPCCSLSCFVVLWTHFSLIKRVQTAQGPTSHYSINKYSEIVEVQCHLCEISRWEAWLLLKQMHHTWPLMLKQITLSDGGTETGKVLLPTSTWGRWRCYMVQGMQMWAPALASHVTRKHGISTTGPSGKSLCSIFQMHVYLP